MQAIIVHSFLYPCLRQMYHIGQVNLPDQRMVRFSMGCLLNIKSYCWSHKKKQKQKQKQKTHEYQAHLKGEIFSQLYLECFFGCFWKWPIGRYYLCVPIRERVSILYPVFLRPDPKWRSKQWQVTDDCHFSLCLCNDVPMEFTLVWGTLLFLLDDICTLLRLHTLNM